MHAFKFALHETNNICHTIVIKLLRYHFIYRHYNNEILEMAHSLIEIAHSFN